MTKVKVQSSNETPDPKVLRVFDIKPFVIDLKFACLREAAPAKAGILAFDIVVSWRSMPWAVYQ